MNDAVGPANIVAASLLMQFWILTIVTAGTLWIRRQEKFEFRFYQDPPNIGRHSWLLLVVALTTFGLLIFSDQFALAWRPLSSDLHFPVIPWRTALLGVFIMDVFCITGLVFVTGGSYRSPFAPVYFILPAMALFLRETPRRVIWYSVAISILFMLGLNVKRERPEEEFLSTGAYAFVSISCLALSVLIGYLTRAR
jgi:hypothetical protein